MLLSLHLPNRLESTERPRPRSNHGSHHDETMSEFKLCPGPIAGSYRSNSRRHNLRVRTRWNCLEHDISLGSGAICDQVCARHDKSLPKSILRRSDFQAELMEVPMNSIGQRAAQGAPRMNSMSRRSISFRLPRGVNIQPWRVRVVAGQTKDRILCWRRTPRWRFDTGRELHRRIAYSGEWISPCIEGEPSVGRSPGCLESNGAAREECRHNSTVTIGSSARRWAYSSP
jgi:hypothetical protein